MKLWKRTVLLMSVTLLCALFFVGALTIWIVAERNLNNQEETCGKQLEGSVRMLEHFWDQGKYQQMTEQGQKSYEKFQFRQCCGSGYALFFGAELVDNQTEFEILNFKAFLGKGNGYDSRIQKLGKKYVILQKRDLTEPAGFSVFSARDITEVFEELKQMSMLLTAVYLGIFLVGEIFIYRMMHRSIRDMEELALVAEKQELLLGALSHEMKTPLTSIIGFSDTLLHVRLKEEQKIRALEHINHEGRRLESLSEKMLQMMGLYQNEAIQFTEQPIQPLLFRVRELEEEKAKKSGIRLVAEGEDFLLNMDQELMESLLLNLTDNALRASREGNIVRLQAFCRGKEKILQVEDQGRGIPREELSRVTEAFYMVDKSRSRKEGGCGLGLALCTKIAELHKGCLSIESQEGKGTVVTVTFR